MIGGRVLFLGFEGTRLAPEEKRILRRVRPAGLTLVPRNVADAEQLAALITEIRSLCPQTILALDGEGGRVDRLRAIVGAAPAAEQLARNPPALARRAGKLMGSAFRQFDFDLDLAPVVDLDHGRANNALDRRTLGSTPRKVETRAMAFIEGLEASGVGACIKHFPGLGAAGEDTHFAPSTIGRSSAELERDLEPFRRLAARAGAVMASHAVYPALDPDRLPATLSRAIATKLLRKDLSFKEVLLSDDLEMEALSPFGGLAERAEAALAAGCDGLLFCRQLGAAPEISARLAQPRNRARLLQATRRLDRLGRRLRKLAAAAGPMLSVEELRARFAEISRADSG